MSFTARLFDELEPCYPDTDVKNGREHYQTAGANGTYAGVNILLSGLTPGIPVAVEVEGEHTAFKLFRMLPVPVEVNTGAKQRTEYLKNDRNENVIRRAPFFVYEALEPIYNIVMADLTTMAVSFKTIIEYCREKRTQHWKFRITHGSEVQELTFDVEQYPFTVPKAGKDTHKFVNWFNLDEIANCHKVPKWGPEFEAILTRYLRAAAFSRQNMMAVSMNECFDVVNGEIRLNEDHFSMIVRTARAAGMVYFQGGAMTLRESGFCDDDAFYHSLDHDKITSSDEVAELFRQKAFDDFDNRGMAVDALTRRRMDTEEGKAAVASMAGQLNAALEKYELRDVWMQSALDEPNDALCDVYREITSIIRREMPGVPILEPVLPTEKIEGALDIWCPSTDVYEKRRDFFDRQAARGDKLFVYTCLTPGGNYANRLLDMERLRIVYLAWAPAKYPNIEGYLHWAANQYLGSDPYKRMSITFAEQALEFHPKRAMFLPAGDTCLFYPGHNEGLISVRSEASRIGYEDLCMLEALKKKDAALMDAIVERVFRSYCDFEKSVDQYRETRRMLLEALES
ncbi:MAG: DUF4091 domain-containing protein [Lachnospiraceae bacterium]|nr:DUF4091 domain-containing protein [Lachnospiraceae bacterium]